MLKMTAETTDLVIPEYMPVKNIDMTAISVGNAQPFKGQIPFVRRIECRQFPIRRK